VVNHGTAERGIPRSADISGYQQIIPTVGEGRRWLTVREACDYLRVGRSTLYRLMDARQLAYHELPSGGGRRFLVDDLDAVLRRQGAEERD
jgi:excisionase family DNA binding protein